MFTPAALWGESGPPCTDLVTRMNDDETSFGETALVFALSNAKACSLRSWMPLAAMRRRLETSWVGTGQGKETLSARSKRPQQGERSLVHSTE
jgi:hypothetical protein